MNFDENKVDKATLALLWLVMGKEQYGYRAWKSFDWETMNRLHEKGFIGDPRSKAKSVVVTEEGEKLSRELFEKMFGLE
jgi:DNA-binding PadR family transcriptional regulator